MIVLRAQPRSIFVEADSGLTFSGGPTLLLAVEEPLELNQGKAFLELVALRDMTRMVFTHQFMRPVRSARSHLVNQVL